jgi:hypothetical protein
MASHKKLAVNTRNSNKQLTQKCLVVMLNWSFLDTDRNRYKDNGCPSCKPIGYSRPQITWLDSISQKQNIRIYHKENNGCERRVKLNNCVTTKVDGLCDDNNTIYEYMGCYWHGHDPKYCKSKTKYIPNDINKTCKKHMVNYTVKQ